MRFVTVKMVILDEISHWRDPFLWKELALREDEAKMMVKLYLFAPCLAAKSLIY